MSALALKGHAITSPMGSPPPMGSPLGAQPASKGRGASRGRRPNNKGASYIVLAARPLKASQMLERIRGLDGLVCLLMSMKANEGGPYEDPP